MSTSASKAAVVVPKAQGRRAPHWLEIAVAAVISLAGLATSWSAYQVALWSGVQAKRFGLASAYRVNATRAALEASTTEAWEIGLVTAWIQAKEEDKDRLAAFYERRLPAEFKPVFETWAATRPLDNPAAPLSPFRMPGYRQPAREQALALETEADRTFQDALSANGTADAFTRGSVILAMAMFFGGIVQVFRGTGVRVALAIMAFLAFAWGLDRIFTLPALTTAPSFAPDFLARHFGMF